MKKVTKNKTFGFYRVKRLTVRDTIDNYRHSLELLHAFQEHRQGMCACAVSTALKVCVSL